MKSPFQASSTADARSANPAPATVDAPQYALDPMEGNTDPGLSIEERERNRRLGRIIAGLAIVAFLIAGVELVAGYLLSNRVFYVGGFLAGVVGVLMLFAKRTIGEGHVVRGATVFSIGLFAAAAAYTLVLPGALGSLALLPVIIVAVFLPFIHGAALLRLVIASWVGGFVLLAINRVWQPAAVLPDWIVLTFRTLGFAAILALTLGLLFIHHQRLKETLQQAQEDAQRLRVAHRELEAMSQAKTRFLNSAAHELRTPLTPIIIQLDIMGKNATLAEDTSLKHSHELMERNVRRLKTHVDELLDIARLQAGQLPLNKKPILLKDILKDVEESFADVARSQGVTLRFPQKSGIRLQADGTRLTQVFFNLISNALKATTKGDEVRVEARAIGDQCVIDVTDTGVGIRNQDMDLLFQPFGQLPESESGPEAGSGLGLFICKSIIEAHGGTIDCRSDGQGHGSTFQITLPLGTGAQKKRDPLQPPPLADEPRPEQPPSHRRQVSPVAH